MKWLFAAFLLAIAALGIAHIVNPAHFAKRSGFRRGGEMLNDWNETGFQLIGLILAAGAFYIIYSLFRSS